MLDFWVERERARLQRGKIPEHIAIIMDGNGTWARRRGLPRNAGHARGADALRRTITEAAKLGVKYLSVYAFSTENWQRPRAEVNYLLGLFLKSLRREIPDLKKNKIQVRFLGRLDAFSRQLQNLMAKAERETAEVPKLTLNILINYGGRSEIIDAIKKIGRKNISEKDLAKYLYTKNIPDPDLLIRTSGQLRLSNFLLWQLAYAELYFTPTLWPDFKGKNLREAIATFQQRKRRFGGL